MANGSLQVVGLFTSILCFALMLCVCILPYWRRNDLEGEVLESIRRSSGLWTKCTFLATGNWNCDAYDRFFIGLPAALQAARALTIIGILFNIIGTLSAVVGLDCTTIAADQPSSKYRCILIAGVLICISGLCIGIAVSWFAANVLYDYHNPMGSQPYIGANRAGGYGGSKYGGMGGNNGDRFVYGECLFLGWAAMILSFLTGILFCCNSYNAMQEDPEEPYTAGYNPPMNYPLTGPKSMGHEYI